jgi:two-component system, NtrC family, sensor histidine kinase PilS
MIKPHPGAILDSRAARREEWGRIKTLIWARLVVVAVALPLGLLLRPDATLESWRLLAGAMVAAGALSGALWAGTLLRRGFEVQIAVHLAVDVGLVSALAALTGGRESQFVLFYVLVAIAGGMLGGLRGGMTAAAAACSAFVALPWVAGAMDAGPYRSVAVLPGPGLLVSVVASVGVLAGMLGGRVRHAREGLERASRELDRLRLDNDVILRHLTSGVITLDEDGAVAFLNPTAEELLEVRLAQVRGRLVEDALPERLRPLRTALLEVLERGRPQARGELRIRTSGGRSLPVGFSTNLLTQEERMTGVVAVFQDLTEVRDMEERARRNQTLAEVGALAAGIAHELRNGLNPISGSVEYLQRELKLEGESAQLLDLISTECVRLNRFVTDLLTFARDREPVKELLALNEQLGELCDGLMHDPRCRPGTRVGFEPGPESLMLQADREQLRQVWLNLGANALEAMEQGGTLTVRWLEVEPAQVAVEFIDNGPGIAAEDLPRVGQPFFTTKPRGTGLGLAIAMRIVELHGGSLAFESAPGRGTTARVTLPGAVAAARAA